MGGQITMQMGTFFFAVPFVKSQRVRALAVTSPSRMPNCRTFRPWPSRDSPVTKCARGRASSPCPHTEAHSQPDARRARKGARTYRCQNEAGSARCDGTCFQPRRIRPPHQDRDAALEQSHTRREDWAGIGQPDDQIRSQALSICLRTRRAATLPGRAPPRSANAVSRVLRSSSLSLQTPEPALDVISS
jgi:hypothetical protein